MTFSRANPLGWALYEELTSTQMNTIDTNQSNAVDGAAGGSYSGSITLSGTLSISGASNYIEMSSRLQIREQEHIFDDVQPAGWTHGNYLEAKYTGTAGETVKIPLWRLIDKSVLTAVDVWIEPFDASRSGSPPATLPRIGVFRLDGADASGMTETQLGSYTTDPWTDEATYETPHKLTVGSLTESIDHTNQYRYYVAIRGEGGSGAYAPLLVNSICAYFTVTKYAPGG